MCVCDLHQRSRAGHPAHRKALCADGREPNTTAFQCSVDCGISLLARRVRHAKPPRLGSLAHRAGRLSAASVAFARYGHPPRFYIRPHFAKWSPAATLKLRLVSATADAPSRVYKTGLMQSGLRWGRSPRRRRTPVSSCPTRRRPVALVAVVAPWHWSVASQLFQSVAFGQL